jgi:LCP family protein required for cell wall assembly
VGRTALAALVTAALLLGGSSGALAYFMPVLLVAYQQTGQSLKRTTATPRPTARAPSPSAPAALPATPPAAGAAVSSATPFTVLLLGSDDDAKFTPDHLLTQSMILVRVIPATRQVTMLSIPRDLWVPLSTGGAAKIDAAYAYGGPEAAIATVERNFQVHIDDYVWIGLKGLVQLIDQLGGVDVIISNPVLDDFYPADVEQPDPYAYERVAVLPGPQHLDGVHALQYVRSRHDDLRGDFGRSDRQQQVLLALRARAQSLNPADLPTIAASLNGEFKTSIGLDRVQSLVSLAGAFNDLSAIHQVVLLPPYTSNGVIGDQEVVLADWTMILPLVHQSFP